MLVRTGTDDSSRADEKERGDGVPIEALIKEHLGDELIGHISRDGTAIEARERPAKIQRQAVEPEKKLGRPRRGKVRHPKLTIELRRVVFFAGKHTPDGESPASNFRPDLPLRGGLKSSVQTN